MTQEQFDAWLSELDEIAPRSATECQWRAATAEEGGDWRLRDMWVDVAYRRSIQERGEALAQFIASQPTCRHESALTEYAVECARRHTEDELDRGLAASVWRSATKMSGAEVRSKYRSYEPADNVWRYWVAVVTQRSLPSQLARSCGN